MKCDVTLPDGQPCHSETHLRAEHHRIIGAAGFAGTYNTYSSPTYQPPTANGGPFDDLLQPLVYQPLRSVLHARPEVELQGPVAVNEEQAVGIVDQRPMASTILGVPITAQQG